MIKENRLKTNSNETNNQMGKTRSFLTKREQRKPQGCENER